MKGAKNTATKKLDPETRLEVTKKGNIEKQRSRIEKSEKTGLSLTERKIERYLLQNQKVAGIF